MFIIDLTYIRPLEEVELHLEEHREFLRKFYEANIFIASGRKNPRTGGVILCLASSADQVNNIIRQDPFHQHQVAEYKITEFIPTMGSQDFTVFLNK